METTFAEILREFLTLKGLTQTAFARAVGVKQSQVSEWLRGKASPAMMRSGACRLRMASLSTIFWVFAKISES